jgi:hypothetical protein
MMKENYTRIEARRLLANMMDLHISECPISYCSKDDEIVIKMLCEDCEGAVRDCWFKYFNLSGILN